MHIKYLLDQQLSKQLKLNIETIERILSHVHKKLIESLTGAQSVLYRRGLNVVFEWQREGSDANPYTEP